ncbi:YgcG family protein [Gloeocapsa sp. PCC 73106]|uniref:TPM domain-containing protein n=1 Tax=Gloeocapsa sp. PCC 73106 TaxID=102232 RepID=UPI0002AD15C9|nr:TPM domain-containing protein [Gloeocapsa sp. PCC 73106]ELR97784.1 beta-propeller domain-containing protein, methanol dehydrogenase [Gloeocapsa sp. PCC 73106]
MKNILTILIVFATTIATFTFHLEVQAVAVQELPNPRQQTGSWVLDQEGIITPATETQINNLISDLESKTSTEIAVVTVDSSLPYGSLKEMATDLYNYWGIGKKGNDNGVLFLISARERRMEIETGYGVEGILPDAKAGAIINNNVIPYFRQGNYDQGIVSGVEALTQVLAGEEFTEIDSAGGMGLPITIGLTVIGLGIATVVYQKTRKRFLAPTGKSQGGSYQGEQNTEFYCAVCKNPLVKLTETNLENLLSYPQQVAEKIGSTKYQGLQCSQCQPDAFHLRRYHVNPHYQMCPRCQEYTIESHTTVLKRATTYSSGLARTTKHCHSCQLHEEQDSLIPRIQPVVITTGSGRGGGGSSGGGGFGGGSSGGGGAGGSW